MRTGRSLTVCWSLLHGGGCLLQGVSALGGCLLLGEVLLWGVLAPGGCLLPGGCPLLGVSTPEGGGVCSGGCLLRGGACSQGGVLVSQHALRQTPSHEQNDRQVQKYYLGHNFVVAGKKQEFIPVGCVLLVLPLYRGWAFVTDTPQTETPLDEQRPPLPCEQNHRQV